MSLVDEILKFNKHFIATKEIDYDIHDTKSSKLPSKELAILTCMDTRLVNFLEDAMNIGRGEAKVVKVAGNCISGAFDPVVRSLLVCIYELGVKEILVIGHHECGMAKTTSKNLTEKMLARGIKQEVIHMIQHELEHWADGFQHPEENVVETVEALQMNPLIPHDVVVHGLMFHPRTGEIISIVDGYKSIK